MKLNYCASWSLNPDFLNGKTTYTNSEIRAVMQTDEWTSNIGE